jgi:ribose-phosphate pyrophosphokinase
MLKLFINGNEAAVTFRKFPAGESHVRIADDLVRSLGVSAGLQLRFESNDDLFNMLLLADAVRRKYNPTLFTLWMPYLPYARQDRVCSPGESLSVKVVADLVNSVKFDRVFCHDIHSDVGVALIDNLDHMPQTQCAYQMACNQNKANTVLVSPDAGANKKVLAFAKEYGYNHIVRADKLRDVATGQITETIVYSEHVGSKDFLIVDDIIDGGRTFIELAKKLHQLTTGKIYLYATHGIFSAGGEVFEGLFDAVYVSNLMGKPHPLIVEI